MSFMYSLYLASFYGEDLHNPFFGFVHNTVYYHYL